MAQLDGLVEAGNTVIVVEHDMRVVAGSDWVIDIGPGAGEEGGRVVSRGTAGEGGKGPREQNRAIPRAVSPRGALVRSGLTHPSRRAAASFQLGTGPLPA